MNIEIANAVISIGVVIILLCLISLSVLFLLAGRPDNSFIFGFVAIIFAMSLAMLRKIPK